MRGRPGGAEEVNELRFAVAAANANAAQTAELVDIEAKRADMWERLAREAWAKLAELR